MPELPELQAHAERLTSWFGGAVLTRFTPLSFTVMRTARTDPAAATGSPLGVVGRRGKYLILPFGPVSFVTHLMQGGRLRHELTAPGRAPSRRPRGGLARWEFGQPASLLLTEAGTEHRVGVWVLPTTADVAEDVPESPLVGLGPDADRLSQDELGSALRSNNGRLHNTLRDQRIIAGIGRRMANDICHAARLSPFAMTGRLTDAQVAAVHSAITILLRDSLATERTRDDLGPSATRPTRVHHRTGEGCQECGDTIREVAYTGYTVHYCPTCQTGGALLADNTTSKFLR